MDPLLISLFVVLVVMALFIIRKQLFRRNRNRYPLREVREFLTAKECAHIIDLARPLVKRSGTVRKGKIKPASILRTSETAFFTSTSDVITRRIKKRIAELSETDLRCQEPLQVTHYNKTEFYAPHRDALGPGGIVEFGETGDRYCTVIIYLNDDYTGGYTRFNRLATRIKPERGKAVLFYNLTEDGQRAHPLSLHGAEPVLSGEKWLINQWIRLRPFAEQKGREDKRQ